MFEIEQIPIRFASIVHRSMDKNDAEVPLVEMGCEISPFTPALAQDLDDFVRATLYTRTDAEVTSKLKAAAFSLPLRPQEIVVRMAPDQKKDVFTILEAKVSGIKATRSKKSTAWTLKFTLTCSPTSNDQLGQIADCYLRTRYLTFADASPDLFAEESKEQKRARRAAAASAAENATTH